MRSFYDYKVCAIVHQIVCTFVHHIVCSFVHHIVCTFVHYIVSTFVHHIVLRERVVWSFNFFLHMKQLSHSVQTKQNCANSNSDNVIATLLRNSD